MVKGELVRQPTACRESASVAAEDMRKSLELLQRLEMEVGGNKLVGEITACVSKALLELEHTGGEDHMTMVVGSDQNCSEVGKSESSTVRRKNKQGSEQKMMARRRRSHPYKSTEKRSNLEDGLTWRKYGQKEIHGAKYPRSYYRCTYKKTRGCKATRQAQKSEEDESIYLITYIEHHTCNNHPSSSSTNNNRLISFGGGHESPAGDMSSESPSTPVTKKHEGVDDQNVLVTGVVRCDGFSSLQEEFELPIETSHTITATVDDNGSVVTSEYLDMGLLEEDDYYNSLDYSYLQGFNLIGGYIFQV